MNWNSWEEVRPYLYENGQIPHDVWLKNKRDVPVDSYDFQYLKANRFKSDIVNKQGAVTGRKIFHNALRKYFTVIYNPVVFEKQRESLYIYNGKYYEERSAPMLDYFLVDNVLDLDDLEGINPAEIQKFRTNLLALPRRAKQAEIDKSIGFLNFNNCVLNTKTLKTAGHTPEQFFEYMLPYSYSEASDETPLWDKVLKLVTLERDELIDTIEFYLGYILTMDTTKDFQYFMLLTGGGENGKSFFIDIIKEMLSPSLYTTQKITKITGERFASAAMENKIAVFSDDEKEEMFKNPDFLKEMVGGNKTLMIEKKYSDPYEIKALAKPIMTTNYMPYLPDTTWGFIRRFLVIPFDLDIKDMSHEEKKEKLIKDEEGDKRIFYPEFPAIIRKCIKRYTRAKSEGFVIPKVIVDLQAKLARYSDQTMAWFVNNLRYTGVKEDRVPVSLLYDLYILNTETGKVNKKKRANFRDDLDKWVDVYGKRNVKHGYIGMLYPGNMRYKIKRDFENENIIVWRSGMSEFGFEEGIRREILQGFMLSRQWEDLNGIEPVMEEEVF